MRLLDHGGRSPGPTLGDVEAGVVATLTSVRTSIVSGGVACVAGTGILSALLPRFWRYDAAVPAGAAVTASRSW